VVSFHPLEVYSSGLFSIMMSPRSERLKEVIRDTESELSQLVREGAEEAEFQQAKQTGVQEMEAAMCTNEYWNLLMEHLQSGLNPKSLDCIDENCHSNALLSPVNLRHLSDPWHSCDHVSNTSHGSCELTLWHNLPQVIRLSAVKT